jgi:hypothetical protein
VDLPASVVDSLEGHRHLRGPYVFCQEDGQPLTEGLMKLPLQRALRRRASAASKGAAAGTKPRAWGRDLQLPGGGHAFRDDANHASASGKPRVFLAPLPVVPQEHKPLTVDIPA